MLQPPLIPPTPQVQRHYICSRAPSAPHIDGRVDKPFWADAPWTEEFVDIEGAARPKPRLRTRAKLLWDDQYLYIAAELEEPQLWATLTERDSIVFHDNDFEVFLNPTGDNHRYYEIEINALNTIFDLFLPKPYRDGGPADHGWDVKGLISAVHIDGTLNDPRDTDRGWSVELAFPWSAFDRHGGAKRPPRDGDQWRINFSRVQWDLDVADGAYLKIPDRPEHNWVWSPQGVIDMHRPEQWGYLQFSDMVAGRGQAEFRPDPSAAARATLHRVYYAQRRFREAHDRWAATLAELDASGNPELTLATTADGWTATLRAASPGAEAFRWFIRQDSLVWSEP
jgi:Carbohydrate family 9 binding domain-like